MKLFKTKPFILVFTIVFVFVLAYFLSTCGGTEGTQNKGGTTDRGTTESHETTKLYPSEYEPYFDKDAEYLARVMHGEAEVTDSDTEMAAVGWCVLNRVDSKEFPNTIYEVLSQENQFVGFGEEFSERSMRVAFEVLNYYYIEKNEGKYVPRTLPKDYLFFIGDGRHNYFTKEYRSEDYLDVRYFDLYE